VFVSVAGEIRVAVKILPKAAVLDSQGRAVEKTLKHHDFAVAECRVGRYVVLSFPNTTATAAAEQATRIAEFVLHNPLIESFEVEVLT
jgi:phosphoribosylformylglycinamidine (FGAM) synthase PurS component